MFLSTLLKKKNQANQLVGLQVNLTLLALPRIRVIDLRFISNESLLVYRHELVEV